MDETLVCGIQTELTKDGAWPGPSWETRETCSTPCGKGELTHMVTMQSSRGLASYPLCIWIYGWYTLEWKRSIGLILGKLRNTPDGRRGVVPRALGWRVPVWDVYRELEYAFPVRPGVHKQHTMPFCGYKQHQTNTGM